jgi:hypothetical protein
VLKRRPFPFRQVSQIDELFVVIDEWFSSAKDICPAPDEKFHENIFA